MASAAPGGAARGAAEPVGDGAESDLKEVTSPASMNSGRLQGVVEACVEELDRPQVLEVSYADGRGGAVKEVLFVDPVHAEERPRMCVSVSGVQAMHSAISTLSRKVDSLMLSLHSCRSAYYKELTSLREQLQLQALQEHEQPYEPRDVSFFSQRSFWVTEHVEKRKEEDARSARMQSKDLLKRLSGSDLEIARLREMNDTLSMKLDFSKAHLGKDPKDKLDDLLKQVGVDSLLQMVQQIVPPADSAGLFGAMERMLRSCGRGPIPALGHDSADEGGARQRLQSQLAAQTAEREAAEAERDSLAAQLGAERQLLREALDGRDEGLAAARAELEGAASRAEALAARCAQLEAAAGWNITAPEEQMEPLLQPGLGQHGSPGGGPDSRRPRGSGAGSPPAVRAVRSDPRAPTATLPSSPGRAPGGARSPSSEGGAGSPSTHAVVEAAPSLGEEPASIELTETDDEGHPAAAAQSLPHALRRAVVRGAAAELISVLDAESMGSRGSVEALDDGRATRRTSSLRDRLESAVFDPVRDLNPRERQVLIIRSFRHLPAEEVKAVAQSIGEKAHRAILSSVFEDVNLAELKHCAELLSYVSRGPCGAQSPLKAFAAGLDGEAAAELCKNLLHRLSWEEVSSTVASLEMGARRSISKRVLCQESVGVAVQTDESFARRSSSCRSSSLLPQSQRPTVASSLATIGPAAAECVAVQTDAPHWAPGPGSAAAAPQAAAAPEHGSSASRRREEAPAPLATLEPLAAAEGLAGRLSQAHALDAALPPPAAGARGPGAGAPELPTPAFGAREPLSPSSGPEPCVGCGTPGSSRGRRRASSASRGREPTREGAGASPEEVTAEEAAVATLSDPRFQRAAHRVSLVSRLGQSRGRTISCPDLHRDRSPAGFNARSARAREFDPVDALAIRGRVFDAFSSQHQPPEARTCAQSCQTAVSVDAQELELRLQLLEHGAEAAAGEGAAGAHALAVERELAELAWKFLRRPRGSCWQGVLGGLERLHGALPSCGAAAAGGIGADGLEESSVWSSPRLWEAAGQGPHQPVLGSEGSATNDAAASKPSAAAPAAPPPGSAPAEAAAAAPAPFPEATSSASSAAQGGWPTGRRQHPLAPASALLASEPEAPAPDAAPPSGAPPEPAMAEPLVAGKAQPPTAAEATPAEVDRRQWGVLRQAAQPPPDHAAGMAPAAPAERAGCAADTGAHAELAAGTVVAAPLARAEPAAPISSIAAAPTEQDEDSGLACCLPQVVPVEAETFGHAVTTPLETSVTALTGARPVAAASAAPGGGGPASVAHGESEIIGSASATAALAQPAQDALRAVLGDMPPGWDMRQPGVLQPPSLQPASSGKSPGQNGMRSGSGDFDAPEACGGSRSPAHRHPGALPQRESPVHSPQSRRSPKAWLTECADLVLASESKLVEPPQEKGHSAGGPLPDLWSVLPRPPSEETSAAPRASRPSKLANVALDLTGPARGPGLEQLPSAARAAAAELPSLAQRAEAPEVRQRVASPPPRAARQLLPAHPAGARRQARTSLARSPAAGPRDGDGPHGAEQALLPGAPPKAHTLAALTGLHEQTAGHGGPLGGSLGGSLGGAKARSARGRAEPRAQGALREGPQTARLPCRAPDAGQPPCDPEEAEAPPAPAHEALASPQEESPRQPRRSVRLEPGVRQLAPPSAELDALLRRPKRSATGTGCGSQECRHRTDASNERLPQLLSALQGPAEAPASPRPDGICRASEDSASSVLGRVRSSLQSSYGSLRAAWGHVEAVSSDGAVPVAVLQASLIKAGVGTRDAHAFTQALVMGASAPMLRPARGSKPAGTAGLISVSLGDVAAALSGAEPTPRAVAAARFSTMHGSVSSMLYASERKGGMSRRDARTILRSAPYGARASEDHAFVLPVSGF